MLYTCEVLSYLQEIIAVLRKLLHIILGTPIESKAPAKPLHMTAHRRATQERELIRRESKIGATLFGPVPAGHTREFFCLDQHTWVWFEEWFNAETQHTEHMNVHYEIQPRGVLKTVNNVRYGYVSGPELAHLLEAIKTYHDRVAIEVYGYAPAVA